MGEWMEINQQELNNLKIMKAIKKLKEGSKAEQARDKKMGVKEKKVESKEYRSPKGMKGTVAQIFGVNPFKKKK